MDRKTAATMLKLNRIRAMYTQAAHAPGDPGRRRQAWLALQAVERTRAVMVRRSAFPTVRVK